MSSPTPWNPSSAYRALQARDARFDGRLFVGVTSTGVYCRPICRVRLPKPTNCRFFSYAAQAEEAGFRPCLKCRPELAPAADLPWSTMQASDTLAHQAAQLLDQVCIQASRDAPPRPPIATVTARLGISDRHLRRIFMQALGVSPVQYVQTRRLLLAKQLLTDTRLPIAQVALSSGYQSLRRFNAAFVGAYRMPPGALRQRALAPSASSRDAVRTTGHAQATITLKLGYRPPYDIEGLLRFFSRRALAGVEAVEPEPLMLRRSLRLDGATPPHGWLQAQFFPRINQVHISFPIQWADQCATITRLVRRWLDLDAQPQVIDAHLRDLPGPPGMRLPASADAFELAVRAVLGQRVSVGGARRVAQRLVDAVGLTVLSPWEDIRMVFPTPQRIARTPINQLAELGMTAVQAGALRALGQAWSDLLACAHGAANEPSSASHLLEALQRIKGLGPWTAHYIVMRWLGWPDAQLPGDVALHKALGVQRNAQALSRAQSMLAVYQPWRSYAIMRLWRSLEPS